jgi:hypothetical protein
VRPPAPPRPGGASGAHTRSCWSGREAVAAGALADLPHLLGAGQPDQAVLDRPARAPERLRDCARPCGPLSAFSFRKLRTSLSSWPGFSFSAAFGFPAFAADSADVGAKRSGSRREPSRSPSVRRTSPVLASRASTLLAVDRPRPAAPAMSAAVACGWAARAFRTAASEAVFSVVCLVLLITNLLDLAPCLAFGRGRGSSIRAKAQVHFQRSPGRLREPRARPPAHARKPAETGSGRPCARPGEDALA